MIHCYVVDIGSGVHVGKLTMLAAPNPNERRASWICSSQGITLLNTCRMCVGLIRMVVKTWLGESLAKVNFTSVESDKLF